LGGGGGGGGGGLPCLIWLLALYLLWVGLAGSARTLQSSGHAVRAHCSLGSGGEGVTEFQRIRKG